MFLVFLFVKLIRTSLASRFVSHVLTTDFSSLVAGPLILTLARGLVLERKCFCNLHIVEFDDKYLLLSIP